MHEIVTQGAAAAAAGTVCDLAKHRLVEGLECRIWGLRV